MTDDRHSTEPEKKKRRSISTCFPNGQAGQSVNRTYDCILMKLSLKLKSTTLQYVANERQKESNERVEKYSANTKM